MSKIKVIQWGSGFTGFYSIRYILKNHGMELVGVKCATEEKEGKTAGELCGLGPQGVRATSNGDDLLKLDADCVVFMPQDFLSDPSVVGNPLTPWVEDMVRILESGKNIVTPLCAGTHWRHLQHGNDFKKRLDDACAKGGSTVVFCGFDPGFTTDALAFSASSVVSEISQIKTWEIIDVSTYTNSGVLNALGLGCKPEDLSMDGVQAVTTGWGGALHLVADAFGFTVEDTKLAFDISISGEDYLTTGGLHVGKGTIDAVRWSLSAIAGGAPVFTINHITRSRDEAAPDWPRIGRDGGYRIEMDSFPPFHGEFPMGLDGGTGATFSDAMAMTAARCVNSVEKIVAAPPGYKTFLDLPPLGASAGSFSFPKPSL